MNINDKMTLITQEAADARALAPYHAVNGLWVCLVKLANRLPRVGEEHEQIASLLRTFSREEARTALSDDGVDVLLNLQPPLETVLAEDSERLHALSAGRELARLRERRTSDPRAALAALFEILQRIRDKREHGFKTPEAKRDNQILAAAASVLDRLIQLAVEKADAPAADGQPGRAGG